MQSYFSEMYQFLIEVIENKDIIERIDIENTANTSRQFQNIVINVQLKHYNYMRFYMDKEEPTKEVLDERVKISDAQIAFYHNRFKWECSGWRDLVVTLESMYHDLLQVLSKNEVKVSVYYNILGHNNYDNICEDNFYDARKDADELDIKEYLRDRYEIKIGESITIAGLIDRIKKHDDKLDTVMCYQNRIEKVIKNQKYAYIISKLIDNKAVRKDYKDNHDLIEAYDAYIDVKKCLSGNKY